MIDVKLLRADADGVARGLARKGYTLDVARYRSLEDARKRLDVETQDRQAARNRASKRIGELVREGLSVDEAKARAGQEIAAVNADLERLQAESGTLHAELDELLAAIPNPPAPDVPDGADEAHNLEVLRRGEPRAFDFTPLDHVDLGARGASMDFDLATKLTGARFVVLRRDLARLHRALVQFMLDLHVNEHGYEELCVPYMVNAASAYGTGNLPKFAEDLFRLAGDPGYYLIPTAEMPVTNIARDAILDGPFPRRYVCHTPCFRSEAGSHGKDQRGMIRQHQFEKVELVQFARPDQSEEALKELTSHAEAVLERLELPYRKVMLCAGDMGFSAYRTYDLEVWLPGQGRYREISSCSNMSDFQARRMLARWRNPATSPARVELLHTLNGSGLAIGRTLIAVLENFQNADGSVTVPPALRPYCGGMDTLMPAPA